MQVLAHLRQIPDGLDESSAGVTWMRTRKANPLDAGDIIDGGEELGEVARGIVRRLVVIHDLAE